MVPKILNRRLWCSLSKGTYLVNDVLVNDVLGQRLTLTFLMFPEGYTGTLMDPEQGFATVICFSKIALFWCCLKSFETGTLVVPEQGRVFVSYQDSSYWCSLKANRGSDGPWVRVDAIKQLKKKILGKWSWKKLRWRKNVGSWCTINLSTLSVRNWLAFYYKNRVSLFYKNSD